MTHHGRCSLGSVQYFLKEDRELDVLVSLVARQVPAAVECEATVNKAASNCSFRDH